MANKNLVFSLCFNLVSEAEKAVQKLYEQNDSHDFEHCVVSCQFPLLKGDEIPHSLEDAKRQNAEALKALADKYGSSYLEIKNVGVSQNWDAMYHHYRPDDSDVMTCCDVDEIPIEGGWVKALGDVLRADETMGYAAPTLLDHKEMLTRSKYAKLEVIGGHNVYVMSGNVNYGLLSISGRLMNKMGGLKEYAATPIYGNIESVLMEALVTHKMRWCILKDFCEIHTNVPILFREWKNSIIFGKFSSHQIPFEEYLIRKRDSTL